MIKNCFRLMLCLQCAIFVNQSAYAKKLTIRPGITIQELYSDNIGLAPGGQEDGAFVTQLTPSVTVNARGARNRVDAALRVENLFFHGIKKDANTFFQGQLESTSRLWANSFFIDLRGTHSQANTRNRGRVAIDNISQTGGRVDVSTYTISPFWRINLGGYARGEARLSYSEVMVNNTDNTRTGISDARVHEEKLTLSSANRFDVWGWQLGVSNRLENRKGSNDQDVHYFNSFGELNFRLVQHFVLFARAGYADNDLGTNRLNSKNGVYYQAGGRWRPSSGFLLSAAGGNNSFINVSTTPFQHAKWTFGFRHNKVGLNTGSQWNTRFQYSANNYVWRTGYAVDTVTTQQVLLERDVFEGGLRNLNGSTGLTVNSSGGLTTLRNEVYERKRGEASVQGTNGKSTVRLTGYTEKRNYDSARQNEDAKGANFAWRWRLDGRTSTVLTADVEQIDGGNLLPTTNQKNTRWGVGAQVKRAIMKYFTATLGYRYSRQEANQSASEYTENRVFARINVLYR
ncbi:MAG TPA: TIGR03016 family PEP-CTERM system-associated outer membrane protein [Crenotrichaceae bacterium]|nr:TIGR03016 family PEP-CTERM system-associated outer membrane protein [Crenotrichaceae bacterium]